MGTTRHLTTLTIINMVRLYKVDKLSIRQIAKRYGVWYNTVYYHLKRAGVEFRPARGGC